MAKISNKYPETFCAIQNSKDGLCRFMPRLVDIYTKQSFPAVITYHFKSLFLQTADGPRFGIEVVGAVAQVLYKTERISLIRYQHKAARCARRQN